jgi:iron complex outermembrane receptor protein
LRTTLVTNINNQRLAAALDAVTDATGKIVCNVTLTNPSAGCVPLNVFGSGAASADAINYVMQPTHYAASTTMDALSGHIEGSPFSTWAGRSMSRCRANGGS